MSEGRNQTQSNKGRTAPVRTTPNTVGPSPSLSSPASLSRSNTLSTLKPATGKGVKTPSLVVKKKSMSSYSAPTAPLHPAAPLFPPDSAPKRYQRGESGEELLNLLKSPNVLLPMPAPVRESSAPRSTATSDKQKIAELEAKLKRLSEKYKRLEGSYRSLLVKSVGRDSISPESEYTRDSAQFSLTPRRPTDEPLTDVVHTLNELKAKVDRIETVTSAIWSTLAQRQ